eukprot:gnl/MRDRNA2_/MRDRNA2_73595_c0_seq1.p1 gnl/MRDRNA2_/MRDRNA2_73595_c0~~gnl/MRDRNA2_/MRDRNA2_73595_c0_seq1.p1  ORF type:complete len:276 (+),score=65.05 gnl/MRDRNA2_/MRDRNA2_73595_c0_seq1:87-914(+)
MASKERRTDWVEKKIEERKERKMTRQKQEGEEAAVQESPSKNAKESPSKRASTEPEESPSKRAKTEPEEVMLLKGLEKLKKEVPTLDESFGVVDRKADSVTEEALYSFIKIAHCNPASWSQAKLPLQASASSKPLIGPTIAKLSSAEAQSLVVQCARWYVEAPRQGAAFAEWLQQLLLYHGSRLAEDRTFYKMIKEPLEGVLRPRLAMGAQVRRLRGKLGVIAHRVQSRAQMAEDLRRASEKNDSKDPALDDGDADADDEEASDVDDEEDQEQSD